MLTTSARLLELLGILRGGSLWSGPELARRLGVEPRTLRKDIDRLRALDYPVRAVHGPGGGYRLGDHGRLPPLLLSEDEAVSVAIGLGAAGAMPGLTDSADSALGKLHDVLPDRLRRRVDALAAGHETGPSNTTTNEPLVAVDPELLGTLADAIRDHRGLRFDYLAPGRVPDSPAVAADPYRLVSWQGRWYLVARARHDEQWRAYRADWLTLRTPDAGRYPPEPLPGGDYAGLVLRQVATTGWAVHARVIIEAPAAEVVARINPAVGVVETVSERRSVLVTGADTYETVAVWLGMLGMDFRVDEPAELVDHLRVLAARYQAATLPP